MNQLLLRVCIALLLSPALLFAALWLGVPWRAMWWAICGLGVSWCSYSAWRQVKREGGRLNSWLFSAALVQTGLWAPALALSIDTDPTANHPLVDAVGTASGIAIFVLLLTGSVGFGGLAMRMLRSNQAVQLHPRRALWGVVLLACNAFGWTVAISTSQDLASSKSNLSVVKYLAANDLQVFTPARYARELLGKHYIWMDDPATPPLGWWQLAGAMADPDDVIRKYAHPKDPWSGAYLPTANDKEDDTKGQQRGFGVIMINQLSRSLPPTSTDAAPTNGGRITDVKAGSPAVLASVQRGDTVVVVNGTPWAQWYARRVTPTTSSNTTTTTAAKPPPSLVIRARNGALITLDKKATFADTGVQQTAWLPNKTLYARLDSFKEHTAVHLSKALRELEANSNTPLDALEGLVVDLRGNQGGRADSAQAIGRLMFGNNLAKQPVARETNWIKPKPELTLEVKDKTLIYSRQVKLVSSGILQAHNWSSIDFNSSNRSADRRKSIRLLPRLKQVLVLTDRGSCSASEYLIQGLRTLTDIDVVTVGQTTCGKPYGFVQRDYAGYQFNVVNMAFESPTGRTVYPNGLSPNCKVIDSFAVPFTTAGDTVLEAALFYAQHQRCP